MAYAGTVARVASRDSGWTQIVDPSSGKAGWIDSSVLSPLTRTADTASTEDSPPKQMPEEERTEALNEQDFEIPDENALLAVKATRHGSNRKPGLTGVTAAVLKKGCVGDAARQRADSTLSRFVTDA